MLAEAPPELLEEAGIGAESVVNTRQLAKAALDKQTSEHGESDDDDICPYQANGGDISPFGVASSDNEGEPKLKKTKKEENGEDDPTQTFMDVEDETQVTKRLLQLEKERTQTEEQINNTIEIAWDAQLQVHESLVTSDDHEVWIAKKEDFAKLLREKLCGRSEPY